MLAAHSTAGDRTQAHDHYLKGTVFCGQCGSRLVITHAKNSQGAIYPYFVCAGRLRKRTSCTRSAMPISEVEKLLLAYYRRIEIPAHLREDLHAMLSQDFDHLLTRAETELTELTERRAVLEAEQTKLLRAHLADAVPLDVLKREQDRILGELEQVNRRLDAHHGEYTDARAHLDDALNLLGNYADIYARCDDANRRLCNQAFFTKVYVDEDDELRVENARPFEMLLDPAVNADALTWAADADKASTPAIDSVGQGSSLVRWCPQRGSNP